MKLKKIAVLLLALTAITAVSCIKDPLEKNNTPYLKFREDFFHLSKTQGQTGQGLIQSNISWKLSVEAPVPDWMIINKPYGSNTEWMILTAIKDNNSGSNRFATITATPLNNASLQPVRITVIQHDSSYVK
jgi:hypothetical protein